MKYYIIMQINNDAPYKSIPVFEMDAAIKSIKKLEEKNPNGKFWVEPTMTMNDFKTKVAADTGKYPRNQKDLVDGWNKTKH